ncbi:MAG: hypothetical protein WC905_04940 [Patescibacteria group bacterium]|jgi:hypothetical protein
MCNVFYVKQGNEYKNVGHETPRFLSDGIWLVENDSKKQQRIAKLGELKKPYPYARMAQDTDILCTYLRALISKYINNTINILEDGSIQYSFPCSHDMAHDILYFLALNHKDRQQHIINVYKECSHIDSQGNVINLDGKIQYKCHTKEAVAFKIQELKTQINELEKKLCDKLIEDL